MGYRYNYILKLSERWSDVKPFFDCNPEKVDDLLRAVGERDRTVVFETLTVKSLLELSAGGMPSELDERIKASTVREYAMLLNTLRDGMARFLEFLRNTKPPVTAYAKKMSAGTLDGNVEETILWTLRECFGLRNLEQAHALSIYEYMVARKSLYNDAVVAYNKEMDMALRAPSAR